MPRWRGRGITNGYTIQVVVLNGLTSSAPLYSAEEWTSVYALEEAFGIAPDEVNYDRLSMVLHVVSSKQGTSPK